MPSTAATGHIGHLGLTSVAALATVMTVAAACAPPPEGTAGEHAELELKVSAQLVNQETGEGYHPTLDEDGEAEDPPEWVQEHLDPNPGTAGAGAAGAVTISGRVFFNDRRKDGLFSRRTTPSGSAGTRCNPSGVRDDGTACSENWLGAYYMVVDVIERDEGYFAPTAWDCKHEDLLTSVAVNHDGTWTASFNASDDCDSDGLNRTAIVLKVRTRFCGDQCFSVVKANGDPYALYHPSASPDHPLLVDGGDDLTVNDLRFHPGGTAGSSANDTALAANYFASMVDTATTLHRDGGIPFYKSTYGEVKIEYPSTRTGSATALSPTEIALENQDSWVRGEVVAHEYGHVVMMRAWGGGYGWDGVGNGGVSWSAGAATTQRIAFKEGWANFISRVVFTETMPYDAPGFDDNSTTALPGPLGEGAKWVTNINKLLSDWYDSRADDDTNLAGTGDHFAAADLYSIWYNLRRMYLDVAAYGGDFQAGLTICDYVDYYLDVRKSVAAVGLATHNGYVSSITDLIYNNNIGCYRPAP